MDLAQVVIWSGVLSLLATGYGWCAGWRDARLCPITPAGWIRHGLVFYAIVVILFVLVLLPLLDPFFRITVGLFRGVAVTALAPLVFWNCFEVPLRLVRHVTRSQKREMVPSDPFAGPVSPERSFLDQIAERKARAIVVPEPSRS